MMKRIIFDVEKILCAECSVALRRFVGHMEGVESIEGENGKIAIAFDTVRMPEEELDWLAERSIENLGYPFRV